MKTVREVDKMRQRFEDAAVDSSFCYGVWAALVWMLDGEPDPLKQARIHVGAQRDLTGRVLRSLNKTKRAKS